MPDLVIRPYRDADEDEVLGILAASLGKTVDDRYRAFFRWKHLENPFGRSLMWVGEEDGRIGGFRSFLRWRFCDAGGDPIEAVRAVDTATHPDFQGRGIFRQLTLHALDEMRPLGIGFVFNTPNDNSRPGYLKMGWQVLGRARVQLRPRSPRSLLRIAQARTSAVLWSRPTEVGVAAGVALADDGVADLLRAGPPPEGSAVRTARSVEFLRWRYGGFEPVASRAVLVGRSPADGLALLRLRERGAAVECTVGDLLAPGGRRAGGRVLRRALAASGADYALVGATDGRRLPGFVATRRLGPLVTWRSVTGGGTPPDLALALGDLELF